MSGKSDIYWQDWQGTLTVDNMEAVAGLLRHLLEDKRYTHVVCRESEGFKPEVHASERLYGRIRIQTYGRTIGAIIIRHPGVKETLIYTKTHEEDPDFDSAHFCFSPDQVTITQRTEQDRLMYHVFAVEKTD